MADTVLDWDCDDDMIDEDFLIDDDDGVDVGDEEEYDYIEDDDFEEFTDEDFEEEEEASFPRFTQNVAPKRGVGGIVRDPNAPIPEHMKDSPIPFNGWDHTLTRDSEDAPETLVSNTSTTENYPSTDEDLLTANATESATVRTRAKIQMEEKTT